VESKEFQESWLRYPRGGHIWCPYEIVYLGIGKMRENQRLISWSRWRDFTEPLSSDLIRNLSESGAVRL